MKTNLAMDGRGANFELRTSRQILLEDVAWFIEQLPPKHGSDAPGSHRKDRRSAQPILQNADRALLNASIDPLQSNRVFVFTAPAEGFGPSDWVLSNNGRKDREAPKTKGQQFPAGPLNSQVGCFADVQPGKGIKL